MEDIRARARGGRRRLTLVLLALVAVGAYAATLLHFGHLR